MGVTRDVAAGRFHLAGQAACNQAYRLQLVATDYAGNRSHTPIQLQCDAQAPEMQVLDTTYRHDRVVSVMTAGAATWQHGATFRKFFDALDYLPPQLNRNTGNLPALRFTVRDVVDSHTPGTPPEALRVSYRYIYDGHLGHQERDWQMLDAAPSHAAGNGRIGPAEYQILVSYQTLLPQALLAQGIIQAQMGNFIARSKPADVHRIQINVEDLAGNHQQYDFPFHLEIWSQKVLLSQCEPATLDRTNLADQTLSQLYKAGAPVSTARVAWPINRPALSLVPKGGRLHLSVTGAGTDTRLKRLGAMLQTVAARNNGYYAPCKPQGYNHYIAWEDGACQHAGSDKWNKYPRYWDWSFQHQSTQSAIPHFSNAAGQQVVLGSPTSFVTHGSGAHVVRFVNAGPFVRADGSAFDWKLIPHVNGGGPVYSWSYRGGWEVHESLMNPEGQKSPSTNTSTRWR